ncbi:guanine nucleotide-binding protein subunit alpha [Lachancea thermotolerans CBS 6340]|uniref:Guanine nucleotide-binding protein alpha-2 subunit n=1 Tax=Lachancea thermotolerans (strain ATCC 56472 / CBS 6340 / NRRL Y-8284) TaxID=559295 RepID=C5DH52_LACTC|nr:KLTH0E01408p [Lachancea thermotolerans CBS 6340]CAR23113.1 KLTH0E01408p [Lachancea thermotolerans CBS 6340]
MGACMSKSTDGPPAKGGGTAAAKRSRSQKIAKGARAAEEKEAAAGAGSGDRSQTGHTTDSSSGAEEKAATSAKGAAPDRPRLGGAVPDNSKRQQSVVSSNSGGSTGPSMGSLSKSGGGSTDSNRALKVLLLGSGESGKSTVLQQLKILHQNGFSNEELLEFKPFIFDNIIETGKDIINARLKFHATLEPESGLSEEDLQGVLNFNTPGAQLQQFPADLQKTLSNLWSLPSTQELITGEHRSSFYLMDSARYFMDNLPRVAAENYKPTVRDVLLSRKKTSGIFDTLVEMDSNLKLHIYDVGGQRSERKKWIHCFDNVTLIIFCVSLSEFDQTLLEDKSQNRLEESLILFDSVVNSRWFARASIVLFLNKIDVFAEKIQHVPLERFFPDYTGGQDINKAAKYILWRFVQLNRAHLNIYPHVTQATDTSNIKLVFAAIKETILENSLKDSGVL